MPETPAGKQYSWAMKDAAVLARAFDTPEVLEPYTILVVHPGQEALVFCDDRQTVYREGTHQLTDSASVSVSNAIRIFRAGGSVHTGFSAAISVYDVRTRVLPAQNITLFAADGSELTVTFSGAYRIGDVRQLVRNAVSMQPAGEAVHELTTDDPFIQETLRQMTAAAAETLRERALQAATAAESRKLAIGNEAANLILRRVNRAMAASGFLLERAQLSLLDRACPYCHRQLSLTEIRSRRCGSDTMGCNRKLEICPECRAIVSPEEALCRHCRTELLWCDRCQTYAQVEKGRFCTRCRGACYPLLPRGFLQRN